LAFSSIVNPGIRPVEGKGVFQPLKQGTEKSSKQQEKDLLVDADMEKSI
jgi:hypothetical protein